THIIAPPITLPASMKMFRKLYYTLAIIVACSCERDINLDVKDQPAKLVVDASIENGGSPLVVLSKSLNYFSTITPEELSTSFVHDAIVTINDGSKTVQLIEKSYTDTSGYSLYYYTVDFTNPSQVMTGKF